MDVAPTRKITQSKLDEFGSLVNALNEHVIPA